MTLMRILIDQMKVLEQSHCRVESRFAVCKRLAMFVTSSHQNEDINTPLKTDRANETCM